MMSYIYLILAQLTVACSIVASKYLVLHVSSWVILQLRFLFATFSVYLIAKYQEPSHSYRELMAWPFSEKANFVMQALCAGLFFNLFLLAGLKHTSAGSAGIITSFLPSMIILFSVCFLNETLNANKILSLIIATIGLLLVNLKNFLGDHEGGSFNGDFLVFMALIPEAFFYVLIKRSNYTLAPMWVAVYMNLINLIAFIPFTIFKLFQGFSVIPENSLGLIILIGILTGAFYVFWYKGAAYIEASVASLFTAVMPVGTIILASYFLQETITLIQTTGLALIVIAIMIGSWKTNAQNVNHQVSCEEIK